MTNDSNITDPLTQNFIDHFINPRNIGEITDADGYAKVGDPSCGDFIKVWIRVQDEVVVDFKYKVFGCGGAIATTSVVSELAIGKHLKDAIKITDDDVIQQLGGIPENKQHCSLLGVNGLRAAVADFLVKDNFKKYSARINRYRDLGYDMPLHRQQIVQMLDGTSDDAKILDVGTGKGHMAIAIARSGRSCTSVDESPDEIYYARLNAIYFQLDEKIEFVQGDAKKLDFPDKSFDAVMSVNMIHHLPQPELVLSEMIRVCRDHGRIILADINDAGQEILQRVHHEEGKNHLRLGWPMADVLGWFNRNGWHATLTELACETVVVARK